MATKIICRASAGIVNEAKRFISVEITYDPAEGCLTYKAAEEDVCDLEEAEEEWAEVELLLGAEIEGLGWDVWDILRMLQQLSLIPDPGQGGG